jgi:hypothetical protein
MAPYTPLNQSVYNIVLESAYAGSLGEGLGSNESPIITGPYVDNALAALAFAQSYDQKRGGGAATQFEINLTASLARDAFKNRDCNAASAVPGTPAVQTPSFWTPLATQVLTAVTEMLNALAANVTEPSNVNLAYTFPAFTGPALNLAAGGIVLVGLVTPTQSGLFDVKAFMNFTLEAAGLTTLDLLAYQSAALTVNNGTPTGVNCEFAATATPITVTGPGLVTIVELQTTNTFPAGGLSATVSIEGICSLANGQPFPIGVPIVLALQLGATNGTPDNMALTIVERGTLN